MGRLPLYRFILLCVTRKDSQRLFLYLQRYEEMPYSYLMTLNVWYTVHSDAYMCNMTLCNVISSFSVIYNVLTIYSFLSAFREVFIKNFKM
jgi:hypothetical protein